MEHDVSTAQSQGPPPPIIPQAKVLLTGVLNLGGTPKALLEITESEPGKAPSVNEFQDRQLDMALEYLRNQIKTANKSAKKAG